MPPENYPQVIPIDPESLEEAYQLLLRFFQEEGFVAPHNMRTYLDAMIRGPGSAVFLARQQGQSLGVATVTTSIGLEHGLSAEMEDLYVLPEARGSGLARVLIEGVCTWCTARGCSSLEVCVTPQGQERHDLISFYNKQDFINTGRLILERKL